jgi:hypothetical protein
MPVSLTYSRLATQVPVPVVATSLHDPLSATALAGGTMVAGDPLQVRAFANRSILAIENALRSGRSGPGALASVHPTALAPASGGGRISHPARGENRGRYRPPTP